MFLTKQYVPRHPPQDNNYSDFFPTVDQIACSRAPI